MMFTRPTTDHDPRARRGPIVPRARVHHRCRAGCGREPPCYWQSSHRWCLAMTGYRGAWDARPVLHRRPRRLRNRPGRWMLMYFARATIHSTCGHIRPPRQRPDRRRRNRPLRAMTPWTRLPPTCGLDRVVVRDGDDVRAARRFRRRPALLHFRPGRATIHRQTRLRPPRTLRRTRPADRPPRWPRRVRILHKEKRTRRQRAKPSMVRRGGATVARHVRRNPIDRRVAAVGVGRHAPRVRRRALPPLLASIPAVGLRRVDQKCLLRLPARTRRPRCPKARRPNWSGYPRTATPPHRRAECRRAPAGLGDCRRHAIDRDLARPGGHRHGVRVPLHAGHVRVLRRRALRLRARRDCVLRYGGAAVRPRRRGEQTSRFGIRTHQIRMVPWIARHRGPLDALVPNRETLVWQATTSVSRPARRSRAARVVVARCQIPKPMPPSRQSGRLAPRPRFAGGAVRSAERRVARAEASKVRLVRLPIQRRGSTRDRPGCRRTCARDLSDWCL